VRGLVLAYYFVLRSVLRTKPHLRPRLTRCRHCRIFFFTHARNVRVERRKDLGCPFGCRAAHRKKRSAERAAAYYRGPGGKMKKKLHNGKRGKRGKRTEPSSKAGAEKKANEPTPGTPASDDIHFDPEMVRHVRMVTSMIEGRSVSREEVLEMLERTLRQHSMGQERWIDYVLRALREERPP